MQLWLQLQLAWYDNLCPNLFYVVTLHWNVECAFCVFLCSKQLWNYLESFFICTFARRFVIVGLQMAHYGTIPVFLWKYKWAPLAGLGPNTARAWLNWSIYTLLRMEHVHGDQTCCSHSRVSGHLTISRYLWLELALYPDSRPFYEKHSSTRDTERRKPETWQPL